MALNPAILSCKSAHTLHFVSRTQIPTKPFQIAVFKPPSISKYCTSYGSSVLGGGTGGGYSGGSGGGILFYFRYLGLLERHPVLTKSVTSALLNLVGNLICQEWFSSVIANWKLWVPFQFLNFLFVPQQFQVLACNSVALTWNVMLSYIGHKEVVI